MSAVREAMSAEDRWHVTRSINLADIIAMLMLAGAIFGIYLTLSNGVNSNAQANEIQEKELKRLEALMEKNQKSVTSSLDKLEKTIEKQRVEAKEDNQLINNKLDRLIERERR